MLADVDISDYYFLEIKYALARTNSHLNIQQFLHAEWEKFDVTAKYDAGTIFIWSVEESGVFIPSIIKDTYLIMHRYVCNIHVAVLEAPGIVSDLGFDSKYHPFLRMCKMEDLTHPDWVLC